MHLIIKVASTIFLIHSEDNPRISRELICVKKSSYTRLFLIDCCYNWEKYFVIKTFALIYNAAFLPLFFCASVLMITHK